MCESKFEGSRLQIHMQMYNKGCQEVLVVGFESVYRCTTRWRKDSTRCEQTITSQFSKRSEGGERMRAA